MPDILSSNFRPHRVGVGLPREELAFYEAQQNAEVFNNHLSEVYQRHHLEMSGPFKRPSNPAYKGPYKKPAGTANQGEPSPIVYTDRALQKSRMTNATRKALGPSWHPNDHRNDGMDDYGVPKASDLNCPSEWEAPIPDKYLQDFNRTWYEDDEDNDADQLLADMTSNAHAPWRNHLPLRPMYGPGGDLRTTSRYFGKTDITKWDEATREADLTHSSVSVEPGPFVRPEPQSFFSWSDSSTQEIRGKRLRKSFRENLGWLCYSE
ncbi:hypothetical protein SLS60_004924 [Paraconiothyrium brasiliense]|uniref:Uncharacterized protein n=1 Tax=Paraconiothyrium brasiliense TaxID=300254 RepID=A0ABR3RLQ9_9PLEO